MGDGRDALILVRAWSFGPSLGTVEEKMIGLIDEICEELARDRLDPVLSAFVDKVDELEFSHLLTQPHYLGFVGFLRAELALCIACRREGLLKVPANPPKSFGCWAWYRAPRLTRSWSRGR